MLTAPWMLCVGGTTFRVSTSIEASTTNYRHKAMYRTANVSTRFPNAWVESSTARTADGVYTETFTGISEGPMWIQAGLEVSAASGTAEALASLQAWTTSAGQIIAAATIQIEPTLNSGAVAYYPIGPWVPELGVDGLVFAIWATGVSGTLLIRPAGRSADRVEFPSAWGDLVESNISVSADGPLSNVVIATTPGDASFVQTGIKVASAAQATLHILVAAKY